MNRLQAEPEQAPSRKCPRCIKGTLLPDGSGGFSCINCGYFAEAEPSVRDNKGLGKKVPVWLSGERRKKKLEEIVERGVSLTNTLAPKQKEVLRWASRGCGNQDIADLLGWRVGTVGSYLDSICDKLQLIVGEGDRRVLAIKIYLKANTPDSSAG